MKIGSKLLFTYFLLIISIFLITSVSFRLISQRYLIHETELQLAKEAKVMSQLLGKSALSRVVIEEKLLNRKALAVTERLLSSKMIIWSARQKIIYTDLKDDALQEFRQGPSRNFVSETVRIQSKNGKTRGFVTLVARLDQVQELNRLMRRSQLFSLVLSALIALVLGLFFKRGIIKPIRTLSEHMKNYSLKGVNKEIHLVSKDEIGELAESFNALSWRLKQYDEDQKVFFQNASHELKTPLMAIQGNAEGILDGIVTGEDVNKSLNVIIAESQRLKRIVEGITYLAKLESVKESFVLKAESLEAIIQEAVKSVAALAEQREINIVFEGAISNPVMVDREKMKRAFINLLGNAIRYAKSVVTVRCSIGQQQALMIEVTDDGPGLAPGEEDKVFQRFYSGDEGGSGIGLAITKAIIEGHGGTIKALIREQSGAIFQISLGKK